MLKEFMKIAVNEACDGFTKGDGGPFGAVIVKDNVVIARAHNMVLANTDPTAHAEVTVIREASQVLANFDLSGCQLFTSSYPCPMCMGAALWAHLDAIFYAATLEQAAEAGFDDEIHYEFLRNPRSDTLRRLEHLPAGDYLRPFQLWNESPVKNLR